jgi:hypothetical protein
MTYELILVKEVDGSYRFRDVFDNILLSDLPFNYNVYAFYYPGVLADEEFEDRLRNLGNITGRNLLVNIGRLDDPNYDKITKVFKIERLPAIVMTANGSLASIKMENVESTAYIRIDEEQLLKSADKTIEIVQNLYLLFLRGEVAKALKSVAKAKRDAMLSDIKNRIIASLRGISKFLEERDITLSIFEGKLELRRTGDSSSR